MDTFSVDLKIVGEDSKFIRDGITFSRCAVVEIGVNDGQFNSLSEFPDSLAVFSELERTLTGSGDYLLFTCACGVADDSGWDYVAVVDDDSTVTWHIVHERDYLFTFRKKLYREAILRCSEQIKSLGDQIVLEPSSLVHPERNRSRTSASSQRPSCQAFVGRRK